MDGQFLLILLVVIIVIASIIHAYLEALKRRTAMQDLAAELHMRFDPKKNRSLPRGFNFIKQLNKGNNRYAKNTLSGHSPKGEPILIFDYHFETGSGKHTQHHQAAVFILKLPRSFPELQIEPENLFSRFKGIIGFSDIDFESFEFSKRYDVRSQNKKFAYDFCHPRMIQYLLRNRNFMIEVDRANLALVFPEKMSIPLIRANHHRILEIRNLMPDYLFEN